MPNIPSGTPMTLDRVNVAASGTPVSILQNFTKEWKGVVSSVLIKAPAANTGVIYVGKANMVIATGVGVIADIPIGGSITIGDGNNNILSLRDIYIDAATNGDGAYVSAIRK
ncbi:MAG: hypothetical protein ACXABY_37685 [Candidatus Thorarchaeota archaeon]|jgi:hypothetical protein